MTEAMLADVAAAHPINYCSLPYCNVAGADQQGRSGQSNLGATHVIKVAVATISMSAILRRRMSMRCDC
jgi:UDP-glucose 4-epimerase